MRGWGGGIALRALAALVCVIGAVWVALWYFIPAPPHELTMSAGIKGGAFDHIAVRYKERLARHHVTLNLRYYSAGNENVRLINDPKSGASTMRHYGSFTAPRRRSTVSRS